ncbi:MAG: SAM-dependent methyltransferase [Porticoccus sp.]|nr:SAM-dependent methyltransferase [Porticoccus sp.]
MEYNFKGHWDNTYKNTPKEELGWFEDNPVPTTELIDKCHLSKDSLIFNAGAGCSILIQLLSEKGYRNIVVNDISSTAIQNLKKQLSTTKNINFIVDDLTNPKELKNLKMIDLWHDRAVLHFFTDKNQQYNYFDLLKRKVKSRGYVIFSEFAVGGANKCCGLEVVNYNEEMFKEGLGDDFKLLESFNFEYKHPTNGNKRKYIYTLFRRN